MSRRAGPVKAKPGEIFLKNIKRAHGLVKQLQLQAQMEEELLTDISVHYKEIQVQASGSKDKIGDAAPDIVMVQQEIAKMITKWKQDELLMLRLIQTMTPEEQKVLILYYLQDKTIEETAEGIEKSYKTTWERLHKSEEKFEKIYGKYLMEGVSL